MKKSRIVSLLIALFAMGIIAGAAQAKPVIRWVKARDDNDVILGTSIYGNDAFLYGPETTPFNDGFSDSDASFGRNSSTHLRFSGDKDGTSGAGVVIGDAVIYAEADSDTTSSNGRDGIVDGTQDGGWGRLRIRGKAVSQRNVVDPDLQEVRTYAEATADAFLSFTIDEDESLDNGITWDTQLIKITFTVEFAGHNQNFTGEDNGNLHIYRDGVPDPTAGSRDRFCNFATFSGQVQKGQPGKTGSQWDYFVLEEDLNPNIPLDMYTNNPAVMAFDDPTRPEQYDCDRDYGVPFMAEMYAPDGAASANHDNVLWGPGSGRGVWIPEVGDGAESMYYNPDVASWVPDPFNTKRAWLHGNNSDGDVDLIEVQEALLQDTDPINNEANDPLYTDRDMGNNATAMQYSRGNTTFEDGLGSHVYTFVIDPTTYFATGEEKIFSIYAQLSANIVSDGGINAAFGRDDGLGYDWTDMPDFSTMYYNIKIEAIPEPGTWMMMISGVIVAGGAALSRRRLFNKN